MMPCDTLSEKSPNIWQACLNLVGTTFHFPVFLESCDDCGLRSSGACLDHVQDRNLSKSSPGRPILEGWVQDMGDKNDTHLGFTPSRPELLERCEAWGPHPTRAGAGVKTPLPW